MFLLISVKTGMIVWIVQVGLFFGISFRAGIAAPLDSGQLHLCGLVFEGRQSMAGGILVSLKNEVGAV